MRILWKGRDKTSLELCRIGQSDSQVKINSTIIGCTHEQTYEVRYSILLDKRWNMESFIVDADINGVPWKVTGEKDEDTWKINDELDFADFKFIDISLTPLTNTLPVKNLCTEFLKLQKIKVLYIDILKNELKIVSQCYSKLDDSRYLYENSDTGFKATLIFDKYGFIEHYPALFERIL